MNLDDTLATLELLDQRMLTERWRYFMPVKEQEAFLAAGAVYRDRVFMAGNGCGKTETAAFEVSRHMTGEYPKWWKGYRVTKPQRVWVAGTSGKGGTEAMQTKLLGAPGNPEMLGTGMIPRDAIVGSPRPSRGFPDAVDSFQVRFRLNGRNDESAISRAVVKTYQQKREDWQGADIDILWEDEEPPEELDTEGRARLRGKGIILLTFTPLLGITPVVARYIEEESPDRMMVKMGLRQAVWKPPDEILRAISDYPAHERDARANGEPLLGSGKVFQTPIEDLIEPTIPLNRVPLSWAKLWAIDFGGGSETAHPFAAVLYAWDREETGVLPVSAGGPVGTVHLLHEIRMTNALIVQHADAMKRVAANVPVAWPHDGHEKERSSGESMAALYKRQGLNMLETHATHPSGGYSTYAGVMDLDAYMQARQLKVGAHMTMWHSEYGQYHYDKGLLVKIRDDLMSATRVGHMMRRRARPVALGSKFKKPLRPAGRPATDPWTGKVIQR